MATTQTDIAAVIVAGGKATRFGGRYKPLLEVGGTRILDRQLAVLGSCFDEIVLAANDPAPYRHTGLLIVADRHPDAGPLAGLDAAFHATSASHLFAVAGDMPYLSVAAIEAVLAAEHDECDVVAPRVAGYYEPLHALYARSCAPVIAARLRTGRYKLSGLLSEENLRVNALGEQVFRRIDPAMPFFTNINSPADLL